MMLTKKDLDEFRALYVKHYGKDLSDAEIYDRASRLIRLFKALYLVHESTIKPDTAPKSEPVVSCNTH